MNTSPFTRLLKTAACLFALCVGLSSVAFADTGSLRVNVTDTDGNPIAGATIRASTTDSLTQKSGVTDGAGAVRLTGLDPSNNYTVTVTAGGHQSIRNDNVQVVSERTFTLDYVMQDADAQLEEILVTGRSGQGQLVDTTSALVATDVTLDLTDSLPTGRSYQSYLQLAPTTKPTLNGNPSSKSGVNYSDIVDSNGNTAGTSSDNVYYIDGVNITDNLTGTFGANFNSEIIQEQQIVTGGVPAEYEGGQGLISRVITKSGSNEFHGSINYYTQNDSLVASNDNLPDSTFSTYDTAFTLGGPILKDQLWFFVSYQRKERDDDLINPDTGEFLRSVNTTEDLGFAKLTWQATDSDRFVGEFFNDPYERSGSLNYTTLNNRDVAREQGGDNYMFSYAHAWDNVVLSLDYASHEGQVSNFAANNDTRNDVAFSGVAGITNADLQQGGYGQNAIDFRNKDSVGLTLQWFLDTSYGSHDIKTGYSMITNDRDVNSIYTGDGAQYTSIGTQNAGTTLDEYTSGTWTGDRDVSADDFPRIIDAMAASPDAQYYLDLLDADSSGDISAAELGALELSATTGNPTGAVNVYRINQVEQAPLNFSTEGSVFYVQDTWNINEHWTVNAGLRMEQWEHFASDGSKVFTFDWEVAPRFGLVYDVKGDGQSKIWGFYGRYLDPIRTNMTAFAGTLSGSVREEDIFAGNQWLTFRTRGGSQTQDGYFAPTTKTPYTDEFMLGYELSLTNDMSVGITYTDRVTKDIMEDYDLGFYTDPAQVGGFALPLSYFGFDTLPDANYFIATLAGGKREYQGVELTFRKRRSPDSRWQALASYSYNDAKGNTNSDSNADLQGDFLYLDPRAPNVYGPQPGNVEHLVKLAASYRWDMGIEVGAVYAWNSGTLYSETFAQYGRHTPVRVGEAYEFDGATTRWLAPDTVGSQKTESFGTLDLRARYVFDFMDRFSAEVFVDLFNVFDDQAPRRNQDLAGGDGVYDFGQPNAWVEPRRFYLGARMNF
ncbi:MAG TPA: TonB-dependent receptor [Woeseiaceae bacterium]|nr:TonB-dependent receptor [Woeseiaceae bacterium]